jgi:hypothetical protein
MWSSAPARKRPQLGELVALAAEADHRQIGVDRLANLR